MFTGLAPVQGVAGWPGTISVVEFAPRRSAPPQVRPPNPQPTYPCPS